VLNAEQTAQLEQDGFCIVQNILSPAELEQARAALDRAVEQTTQAGIPTHFSTLDPNAANIRVNGLPGRDPIFRELLRWPGARDAVEALLGPSFLISNFTANIALPGSGSMRMHSDQALIVPEPWLAPWAMNIIWCLDDVHADNGATRYLPGSHRYRGFDEVPADAAERMLAFEAPAGSFIAMDGRTWHTSGANITADEPRRMMFGYYCVDFIRPQINWEAALPRALKDELDDDMRRLLGLGAQANTRIGADLTRLATG
jgi:ectoine hydroxylase-related dioxygenase (phytanoyl-CoA dioxygenase family)